MDEKVKLSFKRPKTKTIEYGETTFTLIPFISISQQVILIENYLTAYFGFDKNLPRLIDGTQYDLISAEYNLFHSLFQMLTNVDIESLDTDMYDSTNLLELILGEIKNYPEFKERLESAVAGVEREFALSKSTGAVIESFSGKLLEVLESFSKFTPEEVEKVRETSLELLDKSRILSSESGVPVALPERKSRKKRSGVQK